MRLKPGIAIAHNLRGDKFVQIKKPKMDLFGSPFRVPLALVKG